MRRLLEVFSSGGGLQSTAIAALIIQGRLPRPDHVVIADTGREVGTTWDYLESVTRPQLARIGIEVHRIGPDWASMPAHGKDWRSHNDQTLIMPAFTNQTGDVGKLSGFCSARWKSEVVDRYLSRVHGITRSQYRKWIGFSLDERRRWTRILCGQEGQKGLIYLPLVEGVRLVRGEAGQSFPCAGMLAQSGPMRWTSIPILASCGRVTLSR